MQYLHRRRQVIAGIRLKNKTTGTLSNSFNAAAMKWHKAAESIAEITARGERTMMPVQLAGRSLCLVVFENRVYCTSSRCPHAGASLCDGFVDGRGNMVCAMHRYRFSLANGHNSSGEGFHLKTFPVQVTDDGVFVGLTV
jgi:3-phenylpropionate/trans-cinnamate dioxygenase ferredoxin subunit